ncbi:MAG: hypothetical protein IKV76_01420 [Clostridia bacterium]|nr:hypothetical protein [Clostridia bacterium]
MGVNNKVLVAVLCSFSLLLLFVIYLAVDTFVPVSDSSVQTTVAAPAETTTVPLVVQTTVSDDGQEHKDINSIPVAEMDNQQLLDLVTAAVNKTRSYQGQVTVNHIESFEANILECSGGSTVTSLVNTIVGIVTKPVDEILEFNGGFAVDTKDVQLPMLLPEHNAFTLTLDGVKSISGTMNGDNKVVFIEIIEEVVDEKSVPPVNASSLGFFDVSSYDTGILKIEYCQFDYTGSTMEIHIRPDGYVDYADYKMPMTVEGTGSGAGLRGTAKFEGYQQEVWKFNW